MGQMLDARPRSILCDRMIADFRSVTEVEDYSWGLTWFVPGILREFDLPDLIAASAPRPFWVLNAVGPNNELLSESDLSERFKPATGSYSDLDAAGHFRTFLSLKRRGWKS